MSRSYETIKVEVERKNLVHIKCDICGRAHKGGGWGEGTWDVAETKLEIREGKQYPEGGWGTELRYDICPECFKEKLIPALRALSAAEPTATEWES